MLALSLPGCTKHFSSTRYGNVPPETYVSAFPFRDSVNAANFNPQSSRLEVHWWATDADGLIKGYIVTFNKKVWTFTTMSDSVFALPLFTEDTTYIFSVAAIDNGFTGSLKEGDTVAFTDKNGNGYWDKGEAFPKLGGSVDPDPPAIKFPIANTPPVVSFLMNSGQFTTRTDIPETTFTVASFGWQASDLDGNSTITDFYIALNDTTSANSWVELPAQARFVTIKARTAEASTDTSTVTCDIYANTYPAMAYTPMSITLPNMKLNGDNVFYLKAKDVANAYSLVVRMPDTTHTWFVKKPKGDVLIINDYGSQTQSLPFYRSVFDTLGGGALNGKYDVWDIRLGKTSTRKGDLVQPCVVPSFQETLKLYKYILWYSIDDQDFDIAQISVGEFRRAGGKILLSYGISSSSDASGAAEQLRDISDAVDSVTAGVLTDSLATSPIGSNGFVKSGTSLIPVDSSRYPVLVRDGPQSNPIDGGKTVQNFRGVFPSVGATAIYDIQPYGVDGRHPHIGIMSGDGTAFVLGVPLYRFNGNETPPSANTRAAQLMYRVFKDFGAF